MLTAQNEISEFLAAPILTRTKVLASPCPVPTEPGVYGCRFRSKSEQVIPVEK